MSAGHYQPKSTQIQFSQGIWPAAGIGQWLCRIFCAGVSNRRIHPTRGSILKKERLTALLKNLVGVTLLRDSGLGNFAFAAPAKISERAKTARQKWQCSRKRCCYRRRTFSAIWGAANSELKAHIIIICVCRVSPTTVVKENPGDALIGAQADSDIKFAIDCATVGRCGAAAIPGLVIKWHRSGRTADVKGK